MFSHYCCYFVKMSYQSTQIHKKVCFIYLEFTPAVNDLKYPDPTQELLAVKLKELYFSSYLANVSKNHGGSPPVGIIAMAKNTTT